MTDRTYYNYNNRFLVIGLFLALVILAAFWQVNDAGFVNFDDDVYVTENSNVQSGMTYKGIRWAFSTATAEFWHPLTWLSLMLDHELYGLKPGGYHLTNLFLHIASTLLLFWLLHRMTGALWRSAFVAALFALHPLHVESVAWVAERKDTLSTFFWMLTLGAYVYYTEKPAAGRYLLALLCFTCGLMSKPMLVTLPFVMILLDYWPLNRLYAPHTIVPSPLAPSTEGRKPGDQKRRKAGSRNEALKKTPAMVPKPSAAQPAERGLFQALTEKIPFFILAIIFSGLTLYTQYRVSIKTFPLSSRLANAFISYIVYIEKTLWPQNLAAFYPFPSSLPFWQVAGSALLLLLISMAVIVAVRRLPYLLVGWFWYLGILLPVIGIIQVGKHALADRYTYLPLIGLFIMAAWGIPELVKKWRYRRPALFLLAGLIVCCLFILTWFQVGYWQDSITLFRHALTITTDNNVAHNNLGTALRKQGDFEEAGKHFREAIRIDPDDGEAHNNMGNVLLQKGNIAEAIAHYREALRIMPQRAEAHYNLGNVLASQGRNAEAIQHFQAALTINPDDGEAHFNLGNILASQGMFNEAAAHFAAVLLRNPNDEKAHNNLGRALLIQGQVDEAIFHFQAALRIRPDSTFAQDNLSEALALRALKKQQ